MQTLDFDAYREATAPDVVKVGGQAYPLKPASFNKTIDFATKLDGTDLTDPAALRALTAEFSEIAGVPASVMDQLTITEVGQLFRFFVVRQLPEMETAADASPEPESPSSPST